MVYSAYKLNKHGDYIQPWHTLFPILDQAIVPCLVLTISSWHSYAFLRRQLRWSSICISLEYIRLFHSLFYRHKDFSIVNKTKVDVFLESSCFVYDPTDIGNLISSSFAFSRSSLNIWKFSVHILLKPVLKDFEHDLARMWNEYSCAVVWMFFGIALLWDWNENGPFLFKNIGFIK